MKFYRKSLGALLLLALGFAANSAHAECITRSIEAYTVRVEYFTPNGQIYTQLISMWGGHYTVTASVTICSGLNKVRRARMAAAQAAANWLAEDLANVPEARAEFHKFFCAQKSQPYAPHSDMSFYTIAYTGLVTPESKESGWKVMRTPQNC